MTKYVKEFESFIISNKRVEILQTIIPNSETDIYLKIIERLNTLDYEKEFPNEILDLILKLKEKSLSAHKEVKIISLLKEYDLKITSQERRLEIILEIRNEFYSSLSFDFPQPSIASNELTTSLYSCEYSSRVNMKNFDINMYINKLYEQNIQLERLQCVENSLITPLINFERFNKISLEYIFFELSLKFYELNLNSMELLVSIINEKIKTNTAINFKKITKQMTIPQVEFLYENILSFKSDVLSLLMNKLFTDDYISAGSDREIYEVLVKMYMFAKEKTQTSCIISGILVELLEYGLKIDNISIDYFLEYVSSDNSAIRNYQVKFSSNIESLNNLLNVFPLKENNEALEITIKYLNKIFFLDLISYEKLCEILKSSFIQKEYYIASVLRGDENEELEKILGNKSYEEFIKKTEITFCEHNSSIFKIAEKVVIEVNLKNVQTLLINLYEISTENFYFTKRMNIDHSMSFEGLTPTHEYTYSFNEKSHKRIQRVFEIDKIENRRGFYFVEFIGNGISSRAIIKIGKLTFLSKLTINGMKLFILDENSNVCISNNTGVWLRDEFYKSNIEDGCILIPYMKSREKINIVLVHENFADLHQFEIFNEVYNIVGCFLVQHESLIAGNEITVIFKLSVFLHSNPIDCKLLRSNKISVLMELIDNEISIPMSQVFENLEIDSKSEIMIKFIVPAKLQRIEFIFETQIRNQSENRNDSLRLSDLIYLETKDEENQLVKFYMRKIGLDFMVSLLGKNGQPIINQLISIIFCHDFLSDKEEQTLITNEKGEIILNDLEFIHKIEISTRYMDRNIKQEFYIPRKAEFTYPKQIEIPLGEKINLPINLSSIKDLKFNLNFVSLTSNYLEVLRNEDDCVTILPTNLNSQEIEIIPKRVGLYSLFIKNANKLIYVTVHQAKRFSLKTDSSGNKRINNLYVEDVQFRKSSHNSEINDISIYLKNYSPNTRVHIFAYQFLNKNPYSFLRSIRDQTTSNNNFISDRSQNWKNYFISNQTLNEEIQYVLERKNFDSFLGNNLEKPSLLLKRKFNRFTSNCENIDDKNRSPIDNNMRKSHYVYVRTLTGKTITLEVNQDSSVNDLKVLIEDVEGIPSDEQSLYFSGKEIINGRTLVSYGCSFNNQSSYLNLVLKIRAGPNEKYSNEIPNPHKKLLSNFHNFLKVPPTIITNIKVKDEGFAFVPSANLQNYSHFHILALDDQFSSETIISLNNNHIYLRDLSMSNILNVNENCCEVRQIDILYKDSVLNIDYNEMTLKFMDNLENVVKYYSTLNQRLANQWNEFNFLLKIDEANDVELNKYISNYFSHELNIFLYFKHNPIFLKYCLPILKYKNEKTFIDYYLMNDRESLIKYCSTSNLVKLNSFEKCLLISYFRNESSLNKFIKNIVINMRTEAYYLKPSQKEFKRLFYVFINMKISEEKIQEDDDLIIVNVIPGKSKNKDINIIDTMNIKNNLFKETGCTKEYIETHYYFENSKKMILNSNLFWSDLASFILDKDSTNHFLSENILIGCDNISDLIFRLAVLDLPINQRSHKIEPLSEGKAKLTASSNLMIFRKSIKKAVTKFQSEILVSQHVSDILNQGETDNLSEYLINRVYVHETIVSNISSKTINIEILIQIPEGSIPVFSSEYTRTVNASIEQFHTSRFLTYFYFSSEGQFIQYPPSASIKGFVVSKGHPFKYKVVKLTTKEVYINIDKILSSGSLEDIIQYFDKKQEIFSNDLGKIYCLLKVKNFFESMYKILVKRGYYDEKIWRFGFYHNDENIIKEYLEKDSSIKNIIGTNFKSKLLNIDESEFLESHFDYYPIINTRIHKLCGDNNIENILNKEFKDTYEKFIIYLLKKQDISSKDWIRLCYYLIIQERIEEAHIVFSRINIIEFNEIYSLQIQYDYIAAYIDFYLGFPEFKVAKEMYKKNKDFPLKL